MRKLIEGTQENLIMCDNPKCDYTIKNETKDIFSDISKYVNKPCPKCGENLLTPEDYLTSVKTLKIVKFINKWFSWLTIFNPKSKSKDIIVHIHKGVHVKEKD